MILSEGVRGVFLVLFRELKYKSKKQRRVQMSEKILEKTLEKTLAKNLAKNLIEELKATHLLNHPFYQAWMKGELSLAQLQQYAVQYFPHVQSFPRYVSAAHTWADDVETRQELARNLADEEGITGGTPHPELWIQFGEALGVSREKMLNSSIKPAAEKLAQGYMDLCRSSLGGSLGALLAYEHQVPEISGTKIEGLKKFYGIQSKSGVAFFEVHERADVYHTQSLMNAIDRLPESEQAACKQAAKTAGQLLWDFLSEAYEQPSQN